MKIIRRFNKKIKNYFSAWKIVVSKNPEVKETCKILILILVVILLAVGWFYFWMFWYPDYICDTKSSTFDSWRLYSKKGMKTLDEVCEKEIILGFRFAASFFMIMFTVAAFMFIGIFCVALLVILYSIWLWMKFIVLMLKGKTLNEDEKETAVMALVITGFIVGITSLVVLPLMIYDTVACYIKIDFAFKAWNNKITLEEMCSGKYKWDDLAGVTVFLFTLAIVVLIILICVCRTMFSDITEYIKNNIIVHFRKAQEIYDEAESKV